MTLILIEFDTPAHSNPRRHSWQGDTVTQALSVGALHRLITTVSILL